MSRNSVKVMIYSYFLNLKSYINTYISVTYTEPTVSNIIPQGNHNDYFQYNAPRHTVSNIIPQGNHNIAMIMALGGYTVSNHLPKGNHNGITLINH